jgi:hypothetical protein
MTSQQSLAGRQSRGRAALPWKLVAAALLQLTCTDPERPPELESAARRLMGDNLYTCEQQPNGVCATPAGGVDNFNHMVRLSRIATRSAAFVQCMERAMRGGIPRSQTLIPFNRPTSGCGSDSRYTYSSWGPYVACRVEADTGQGGVQFPGARNNHDGAWDELPDRQLARALTSTQANLDLHHVFQETSNGARQEGYAAGTAYIRWFGTLSILNLEEKIGTGNRTGTLIHEEMHDLGYDHGCFPGSGTDHGNCGRDYLTWDPNRTVNNITAFCAAEVLNRSRRADNPGCGTAGSGSTEDLLVCAEGGRFLVSSFTSGPTDPVDCHCVPDSIDLGQNQANDAFGSALAAEDFNGDGYQDLATGAPAKSGGGVVYLFRGSAGGLRPWRSFAGGADLGVSSSGARCGAALAAGDFNADGVADLAVGCPDGERVVALPGCRGRTCPDGQDGLRSGSRLVLSTSRPGGFGSALATGDYNRDGTVDLAVGIPRGTLSVASAGLVEIKRGNRTGTLLTHLSALQASSPQSNQAFGSALTFGDVAGAPGQELIVGAPSTDGGRGAVFVINAVAVSRLATPSLALGAEFGRALAVGDVAGDAIADVVIGAPGVASVYVANGGSSVATAALAVASTRARAGASVAVLFRSSFDDLVVGAPGSGADRVLRYGGGGTPWVLVSDRNQTLWSASHNPGDGRNGNCPRLRDIDSDERCPFDEIDFASDAGRFGSALVIGDFGQGQQIVVGAPGDTVDVAPAVASGSAYVLGGFTTTAQEYRIDQVGMVYGGNPPTLRSLSAAVVGHQSFCVGQEQCRTGDINGDGRADLITFVRDTSTSLRGDVWVALANGTASEEARFGAPQKWHDDFCLGQEQCEVGDVNGDGLDDIVTFVRDATPAFRGNVFVALSNGSSFGPTRRWTDYFCVGDEQCRLADINGDRRADIVTFVRDTNPDLRGNVWVKRSTGSAFGVGERWNTLFCVGQEECRLGDVNGDGLADAVVFIRAANPGFEDDVIVALSDGSRFGAPVGAAQKWHDRFCIGTEQCELGDMNGDGFADAVAMRHTTGQLSDVWVSLSNGRDFGKPERWTDGACRGQEVCRLADATGDGRADVVAFVRDAAAEPTRNDVLVSRSGVP